MRTPCLNYYGYCHCFSRLKNLLPYQFSHFPKNYNDFLLICFGCFIRVRVQPECICTLDGEKILADGMSTHYCINTE